MCKRSWNNMFSEEIPLEESEFTIIRSLAKLYVKKRVKCSIHHNTRIHFQFMPLKNKQAFAALVFICVKRKKERERGRERGTQIFPSQFIASCKRKRKKPIHWKTKNDKRLICLHNSIYLFGSCAKTSPYFMQFCTHSLPSLLFGSQSKILL